MEIGYYELTYDDIEKVSQMEREFFSTPWSEASIAHYMEAGNTIFVVARHGEDRPDPALGARRRSNSYRW